MEHDLLKEARKQMDPLADQAITDFFTSFSAQAFYPELSKLNYNNQKPPAHWPESMHTLWEATSQAFVPEEAMPIAKAQTWAAPKLDKILHVLGFFSLPYCYAAADGAKVLVQSHKIINQPDKRLADTAAFVLDLLQIRAFESTGKGFVALFKTRLFHAATRYFILSKGSWDEQAGMPINQEDMAGTLLSFSSIVLQGLGKLEVKTSMEEKNHYVAAWAAFGKRLGIQDALRPDTYASARALEQAIEQRHFRTSAEGSLLAGKLVDYYLSNMPIGLDKTWPLKEMRYMLGTAVANLLQLPGQGEEKPVNTKLMMGIMRLWIGGNNQEMKKKMIENQLAKRNTTGQ